MGQGARRDGGARAPAWRHDPRGGACAPKGSDPLPERPADVAEPHPQARRIYCYYVTREAIADGYDTCAVTSVPAADVEGAVLDHVQKLLAAPELVARTWATAKRNGEHEITEREVTVLLADFATVWNELFPAEQARIVQLLVERVDVQEDALEVRIRAEGLASLVGGAAAAGREEGGMMSSVETRLEGSTLIVRIPMRFQRRGAQAHRRAGRQRDRARSKPQPDGTLVKALARAWRWQRMLDEGVTRSARSATPRTSRRAMSAGSCAWRCSRPTSSRRSSGNADQSLILERLERPLPMDWREQGAFLSSSRSWAGFSVLSRRTRRSPGVGFAALNRMLGRSGVRQFG